MSLRFFADQCVSDLLIQALRNTGAVVMRLKDHIPADSPDSTVIAKAQELDAILVSLNGYFADIVTYSPANYLGIVALQMGDHPEIAPYIVSVLKKFVSAHPEADDYKGKLFLVEVHRVRIRG